MPKVVSNVPEQLDLKIYQGTSLFIPFEVHDPNGPVDLTDFQIRGQIRSKRLASDAVDFAVLRFTAVRFYLLLTPVMTAAIECGELPTSPRSKYRWDAEIESPTHNVYQLRYGEVTVYAQVTR